MMYMVIICKHHDGFSMYDSKLTEYDIMATPYGKDIVRQFSDACHKAGMRLGLYYSTRDWYHPDYLVGDNKKYDAWYRVRVREGVAGRQVAVGPPLRQDFGREEGCRWRGRCLRADELRDLLAAGRKIEAIKTGGNGAWLAAAKDAVEALERGQPLPTKQPEDSLILCGLSRAILLYARTYSMLNVEGRSSSLGIPIHSGIVSLSKVN
jgi:hypothetical protein